MRGPVGSRPGRRHARTPSTPPMIVVTGRMATDGASTIAACDHRFTGLRRVDRIVSDRSAVVVGDDGLTRRELAPGHTITELRESTGAPYRVAADLAERTGATA